MTGFRGWIATVIGAGALVLSGITGAQAAGSEDIKACSAVSGEGVRLACFDAAAEHAKDGDIAACAKVGSDRVRLACFDAAAGSAPEPAGTPDDRQAEVERLEAEMKARETATQARLEELERQAAEAERRAAELERLASEDDPEEGKVVDTDPLTAESYGKEARHDNDKDKDGKPDRPEKITAKIVKIERRSDRKVQVTLDNGQVWKQIDGTHARWSRKRENTAEIRRAALGSFLMVINGKGAAIRVRRIK